MVLEEPRVLAQIAIAQTETKSMIKTRLGTYNLVYSIIRELSKFLPTNIGIPYQFFRFKVTKPDHVY
jgi:hypothetical protein